MSTFGWGLRSYAKTCSVTGTLPNPTGFRSYDYAFSAYMNMIVPSPSKPNLVNRNVIHLYLITPTSFQPSRGHVVHGGKLWELISEATAQAVKARAETLRQSLRKQWAPKTLVQDTKTYDISAEGDEDDGPFGPGSLRHVYSNVRAAKARVRLMVETEQACILHGIKMVQDRREKVDQRWAGQSGLPTEIVMG